MPEDSNAMDFLPDKVSNLVKQKKKSGGFQSMGLSFPVLKGILKKGYKVPTPIQRKTIPVILEGKNVIAMARTGSGKSAAFLVPMLAKLKCRVSKTGARALIFSPTRELAQQTMKFTNELGKYTGLKAALILGGEKIDDQFAAIHESPDIIIATPGRFLHVIMEMDLKLTSVEYVVFDEADRLFEMGFQDQLKEVLNRLTSHHQTLLFSATLPKVLVDFVKAGIEDPMLIRLDVEMQISENLKATYLMCRSDDKPAVLLHLLKNVVSLKNELTVVFLATKHHVEYIKDILESADIPCSYIYSSLDQMARKIHIAKFRAGKVNVLLVTDIAARGIDIPMLDNVINYNFPAKPKLYVHRVGRVARAGRSGKAFSLLSPDEAPYLLDLHLFLGTSIKFAKPNMSDGGDICGSVPQTIIDEETDLIQSWHQLSPELSAMAQVTKNAYQKYLKSRPTPSNESIKRVKQLPCSLFEIHPIFIDSVELERNKFLSDMKNYRPNTTIFELGPLAKTQAGLVMRQKRQQHSVVSKARSNKASPKTTDDVEVLSNQPLASENDLASFNQEVEIRDKSKNVKIKRKNMKNFKDTDNYLSYMPKEHFKEKGLELDSSFAHQAASAVLDLTKDEDENVQKRKMKHWDRKKKKFVQDDDQGAVKKVKTESGVWIPKSYKTDVYKRWQEKSKIKFHQDDSDTDPESQFGKNRPNRMFGNLKRHMKNNNSNSKKSGRRELKSKEEILKARERKAKLLSHQRMKQKQRKKKKSKR